MTPLLVIGLDGATLDLVGPWVAAGVLPHLGALMARGAWARLRSTLPPATFPAWTSLVTGTNPGRHGVLDFTERVPGSYRLRLVNRTHRRVPALWNYLAAAGRRVAVITVPATYPPEPIDGVMVSGWDSPLATAIDGSFVHPRGFYAEVRRLVGRLPFADFQEVAPGAGWHARALARLLDGVERRTRLATALLRRERWDALMVVFGESDTVAHHFWRFHDPNSPRHEPSPPAEAAVAVVSDHGAGGAGDRVVHLNRRLADAGLLAFRPDSGGRAIGLVRGAALRAAPPRAQGALVRRVPGLAGRIEGRHRYGGVDWRRTAAFSDELDYHPSVWINLRGREPEGTVAAAAYEATRERVAAALLDWRDERGERVIARVWRREELYHGPCVDRAPDLLLELAEPGGYRPSCLPSGGPGPALRRLAPAERGGGKGAGMNGSHRRDGLVVLAGAGVRAAGELPAAEITDVLPTLLALAGLPVPADLDGRPLAAALARRPRVGAPAGIPASAPPTPLDRTAEREIAARLAALGYL